MCTSRRILLVRSAAAGDGAAARRHSNCSGERRTHVRRRLLALDSHVRPRWAGPAARRLARR